ncbi:hypothetical protein [Azospirillum tabaci]|uniref:hypothetical protein n=1 Tax=Azospirillum tabaci TaxID=2752310 RepID=UPI0016605E7A|nr:hypothetical protein [Azospirillum tabaci]
MKTDPENTMILSEARDESVPGEHLQDVHILRVSRSPADVLDLQGRCAVLAEAGGDGAVEAGAISDTFDWLFGSSDLDPLAGYGESSVEGDSEQAGASGSNVAADRDVAGRLKLLEDAFATTVMTGNGMIALAKSLGTSLKQAEAERDALRNETMDLCEVVNRLVSQAYAARSREDEMRDVLRFDPTAYPAMETTAIEQASKLFVDPVSLLEACGAIAEATLSITQQSVTGGSQDEMLPLPFAMKGIIDFLARCGLVFIKGEPPANEDNVLLLWTGGCNAITALRKGGEWLQFPSLQPLSEDEKIHCWMRMPHPSIWPEVRLPANMFSEHDLYRMEEGAIARAAAQAAWTIQAGTHAANAATDIAVLLDKMQSIVDETPAFSGVGPMAKQNLAELGDLIEVARKRLVDVQPREDR